MTEAKKKITKEKQAYEWKKKVWRDQRAGYSSEEMSESRIFGNPNQLYRDDTPNEEWKESRKTRKADIKHQS